MARKYPEYKHLNLPEINKQILQFWKENKTFEKSITSREGKPSFTFYEGPPSANGLPGIHHVMARAIKDIFCRFKTLEGYQVKRKAGWDTHGLPVELGVEKELGITKEDIGKKISVEEYNDACKKAVMRYTDVWNDLTEKMGYWVDMDDPYVTYKPKYMETVWWLLKQLWDQDLIYKGYTIQPYSPKAGTGLSSHELNMPGSYRDVKDTSAIAQFKLDRRSVPDDFFKPLQSRLSMLLEQLGGEAYDEDSFQQLKDVEKIDFSADDIFLTAWTTTPWTLPSNTALTVNPNIYYSFIWHKENPYSKKSNLIVVARDRVLSYFRVNGDDKSLDTLLRFEDGSVYLGEIMGKYLVGLKYEQLLPYAKPYQNPENAFRVIAGDFVTTEDGTGIVHTAPTFGADDAKVAREASPEVPPMLVLDEAKNPVPLVDLQGRFRPEMGDLAGKYVKNEYYADSEAPEKSVDVEIAIKLKEENKAFKVEKYEHSYPHCWRTDKPVLYYPLDSWFIKVTAKKQRLVELNKTINWKPKSTGEGRFGNWLENANDWNLSRSRYWGIPLPIWSTEDGSERQLFGSVAELKKACDEAVEAGLMESHPLQDFTEGDLSDENYSTVDLHRHIVDEIVLQSPSGKPMKRENDLIDVWFDSGSMPYAQWHYPFEPIPGGENSPLTPEGGTGLASGEQIGDDSPGWHTANPEIYEELKTRAKNLRENETETEKKLWEQLRSKNLGGYKFRRQHIIGSYVVDFVCLTKKVVVELDGKYHLGANQKVQDAKREEDLTDLGFEILRFKNDEVLEKIDQVKNKILEVLENVPERITSAGEAPFGGLGASAQSDVNTTSKSPLNPERGALPTVSKAQDLKDAGLYPADFIAEGVDQTRGWFYTLHAIAGLIFDSVAYKNVVSNGLVLDKNGQKMSKRLGNAVDPFKTIEKYGTDPVRWYMMANAQPWDNLKFDLEGVAEVQRKFFGTLYNTYGFFALYANIDEFEFDQANLTAVDERPELDRWILSRLQVLKQNVREGFGDYEPTRSTRAIQNFVDEELSNWYVRLCRRRFWKGEMNRDKQMAYETLYECLFTLSQLISPVAPFFADWLYQNLTAHLPEGNKEESVHLTYLSEAKAELIDERLNQRMALARQLSSMVFALRKKESIKVRQPLQKMMVPALKEGLVELIKSVKDIVLAEVNVKELEVLRDVSGVLVKQIKPDFKKLGPKYGKLMKQIAAAVNQFSQEDIQKLEDEGSYELEINGEQVSLTEEDVNISTQDIPGWLVMTENHITVALDISIDENLRLEGVARELVNRVQNLRKETGLEVTDRIALKIEKQEDVVKALEGNGGYLKQEVLASDLQLVDALDGGTEIEFDEIKTRIAINKV